MNDPHNPYGAPVPPTANVAESSPGTEADPISCLDVAESWKRKFRLIDKAGGPDIPRFRELSFGERFSLNFNILAFFFGPFYYLAKGLWRQAIIYFIFAVAVFLLLEAIGLGQFSRSVGYGLAAGYAVRANISYYKKVVLGNIPWL